MCEGAVLQYSLHCDSPGAAAAWSRYNRRTFGFRHGLADDPLFSLDSVKDLLIRRAARTAPSYVARGRIQIADPWKKGMQPIDGLLETLEHIAVNDSLILLSRVEADDVFGPFVRSLARELSELTGPALCNDAPRGGRATLLIASPRRITSYHIDADTNFLFQLQGDKTLHVFDQQDSTLLTQPDLERFFNGDPNGARYPAERQKEAVSYDLLPGLGVHIPSTAPHWAQNGSSISIALSINFDLRSIARVGRVHRSNHYLRRLGMSPTVPGRSRWRDLCKICLSCVIDGIKPLHSRLGKWRGGKAGARSRAPA